MHRPRPNKLHDELDALLDGRPVELTDELAPLVEAADVLRIELATYRLDPKVADRHLERVLDGSGSSGKVVPLPVRRPAGGWDVRRRVVAVALAAALVLAPATIASAAALPGQAMYPFKLAIEQVRLASVQWSTTREAGERTRVADERRSELEQLLQLQMFSQVGPAVRALAEAVQAAERAVDEARQEAPGPEVAKLAGQLASVQFQARRAVTMVAETLQTAEVPLDGTRIEIQAAVQDVQKDVLRPTPATPPATATTTPTQTTAASPATQTTDPPTEPTEPPANPAPTPTPTPPPPSTPTTTVPTTTTVPPPPEPTPSTAATPGSGADAGQERDTGEVGGAEAQPPTGDASVDDALPASAP